MVLAIGKGHRLRRRGYSLRVCPICRSVRVFSVHDFEQYTHVYFLAVTQERAIHTTLTCEDCGVCVSLEEGDSSSVHHTSNMAMLWELLKPEGQRALAQAANDQLDLLQRTGPWEEERRQEALASPFRACEMELAGKYRREKRHASRNRRIVAGVCGLLFFLAAVLVFAWRGNGLELAVIVGIGTILILMQEFLLFEESPAKYYHRRTLPRLLRSLRPLQPTREELSKLKKKLESEGLYISRADLFDHVEREFERARLQPPSIATS